MIFDWRLGCVLIKLQENIKIFIELDEKIVLFLWQE